MLRPLTILAGLALVTSLAEAQTNIADRVRGAGTRTVALTTRARPEVCGDGIDVVSDGLGGEVSYYSEYYESGTWVRRPCAHGPVRLTLRVVEGVPSRIRVA